LNHFGKAKAAMLVLARIGNAVLQHAPLAAGAKLIGNGEAALAHWLMLVRTEGYVRCYLHAVAPRLFPQSKVFRKYGLIQSRSTAASATAHS
jgi:hypothetical protein